MCSSCYICGGGGLDNLLTRESGEGLGGQLSTKSTPHPFSPQLGNTVDQFEKQKVKIYEKRKSKLDYYVLGVRIVFIIFIYINLSIFSVNIYLID